MASTVSQNEVWVHKTRKYRVSDGVVDLDTTSENVVVAVNTVTKGENYTDWKWRIQNGFNATTTLTGKKTSIRHKGGSMVFSRIELDGDGKPIHTLFSSTVGYLHGPSLLLGGDPDTLSETEANNQALTRFNQRCYEVSHKFQGGVFLGELAQTLRGIRHPAEALSRGLRSYNSAAKKLQSSYKRKILEARRTASEPSARAATIDRARARERNLIKTGSSVLSGLWLEGVFHWQPLLHDVDDAMQALADRYTVKPKFQRVSATGKHNAIQSRETSGHVDGAHYWDVEVTVHADVSVTYRGAVGIEASNPVVPDRSLWGFDLASFVPTLWELLPYSFLIDYFANVGDVLNGWSSGGHNVRWAAFTSRKQMRTEDRVVGHHMVTAPPGYVYSGSFSPPLTISSRTSVFRVPYQGSFIPLLTWKVPTSTKKLLNVGALVAQKLAGFL